MARLRRSTCSLIPCPRGNVFRNGGCDRSRPNREVVRRFCRAPCLESSTTPPVSTGCIQGFWTGRFSRAHVENLVGCLPPILFASAIWLDESEPIDVRII